MLTRAEMVSSAHVVACSQLGACAAAVILTLVLFRVVDPRVLGLVQHIVTSNRALGNNRAQGERWGVSDGCGLGVS